MNKYFIILLILVLTIGFSLGYFLKSSRVERVITIDTLVQTRVETEMIKDTVIKLVERVIYKNVTPEKEYTQRADTVFLTQTKYLDFMLKVRKRGDKLVIHALNKNDSLIKEYVYDNVSNDFTATSATGNIFVKSKNFDWNGIDLIVGTDMIYKKEPSYYGGLKTGIKINRLNIDLGWIYSKDFMIRGEIGYRLD